MQSTAIRKSRLFIIFTGGCGLALVLLVLHAHSRIKSDAVSLARNGALVSRLGLTDPCLFTEARYTRHPSQADRHSAFQDHPLSLEHFPAGAVLSTPPGVR